MSVYDQLIAEGIEKGREEGMEKGKEKAINETVLKAYKNGFDLESIRLITGKSNEEIKFILNI